MKAFLLSTAALLLAGGIAVAQTTTQSQTTVTETTGAPTTVVASPSPPLAPLIPPPPGTLATVEVKRTVSPDGTVVDKNETTYRNTNGVADDSVTKTTTYAPAIQSTTTSATSSTVVTDETHFDHSCPPREVYDEKTEACVAH